MESPAADEAAEEDPEPEPTPELDAADDAAEPAADPLAELALPAEVAATAGVITDMAGIIGIDGTENDGIMKFEVSVGLVDME